MDFGGGFATGIGVGMGSGIAVGTASGQKLGRDQIRKQVREYIEQNGIEIVDRYGKPIKLDTFMDNAVSSNTECCSGKKGLIIAILVAVFAVVVACLIFLKIATGSS